MATNHSSTPRPASAIDAKNIKVPSAQSSNASSVTESGLPSTPALDDGNSIITVVRDVKNPLGKHFKRNADGTYSKTSSVTASCGMAVMHRIESHEELAALLQDVGDDPHAAIINADFAGIEVGEAFVILSERQIERRFDIPRSDREWQKGVHDILLDGKTYKAVGRFKENVRPSCWQIIDRDVDAHTPAEFANLSDAEWLREMGKIMPGLDTVSHVSTASTSSRVLRKGQPVGAGNGHLWVRFADPLDIERARTALMVQAADLGKTWMKPRYSRTEPGKVVGQSLTTICDPSVWTPGRLIFIGKPVVGEGLTVAPPSVVVHRGEIDTLDTAAIVLPDTDTVRRITRQAGIEMDVQTGGDGLRITAHDLTLDTEVDTEDHGPLTVRQIIAKGITGKVRCQTPFRDSSSFAAFLGFGADGTPFIYDIGTGITHWLNAFEAEELQQVKATCVHKRVERKLENGDSGAALDPDATVTASCGPPVKATLKENGDSSDLPFPEVQPYPTRVDPESVLNGIADTIRRFIVMSAEQIDAMVLWVVMTWFIHVVDVAPLAIINAPEKSCGKSQLLDVMGRMSARPLPVANATTAATFRSVELWSPTMLIDEADTFIPYNKEINGIINAGHTRANAYVLRTVGDDHKPKRFTVWCPKAMAGIALEKHLPDSTMSRAVVINLLRKLPHETVERLRHAEPGLFDNLASKLARFADDYAQKVQQARPNLPDALNDRAQDNWEPLLAIAECAGPEWVRRATAAALKLSGDASEAVSTGNQLLADIRQAFESKQVDKIRTTELIEALVADDEGGWATYNWGKQITPRQLGRLLSGYGIRSKTVRFGKLTPKGYELSQFTDAFARYLPEVPQRRNDGPEASNVEAEGVADGGGVAATPTGDVTPEPMTALDCGGVADPLAQLRGFALDFAESKKLLPYESMPGLWITTENRL